ncbi:MAG: Gfo/Idh/MocA family oxidoreductase [Phycisphaerae bacterium]|nr:Gfo/Idh/MocA family oxidoreductase [Phycisphaerae bacterium]
MPLGIGVAGFGAMGRWHANAAQRTSGLKLVSVLDITPTCRKDAAKEHGCDTFAKLDEFVADERLDAVVVATPSNAHVEPVLAALRAGKHVLCDKPLVQTESQARRLFTAAEKAKRLLMTFQNRRLDGHFLTTADVVASGKLGPVQDIRYTEWAYTNLMQTFGVKGYRPGWRSEAAYGGGVLLDFGPHYIDQLLQMVSAPVESVYAIMQHRRWTRDADDQFLTVIRFRGDVTATIEVAHVAHPPIRVCWAINGPDGGYLFENDKGRIYTHTASRKEKVRDVRKKPDDWDGVYRNFRDAILGKAEPMVRPHETLRLMRVLDAIRRSSDSGCVVTLRDEYAQAGRGRKRAK